MRSTRPKPQSFQLRRVMGKILRRKTLNAAAGSRVQRTQWQNGLMREAGRASEGHMQTLGKVNLKLITTRLCGFVQG